MTTIIQHVHTPAMAAQPTTAPVREHSCLFTHDLRRKQKRWQDGRLKHHTYNGRIMVHDERGNFIGDTHWRETYDLEDGEEVELDRSGVIVQVGECVGSRDQDLSELVDKRAQERAQRQAAAAAKRPQVSQVPSLHSRTPQAQPPKHLHSVIGTPSGHHGRALIPTESPFEAKQKEQAQSGAGGDEARPAKRVKTNDSHLSKSGYAQNLFGATLSLSGRPLSQAPARHRPSHLLSRRDDSLAGNDSSAAAPRPNAATSTRSEESGSRNDRRKPNKSGYAQNLFGASLSLSGGPPSQPATRHQTPKVAIAYEDLTATPSSDHDSADDGSSAVARRRHATPPRPHNALVQGGGIRGATKSAAMSSDLVDNEGPSSSPPVSALESREFTPPLRKTLKPAGKGEQKDRGAQPALKPRSANTTVRNAYESEPALKKKGARERSNKETTGAVLSSERNKSRKDDHDAIPQPSKRGLTTQSKSDRSSATDITDTPVEKPLEAVDENRTELRIRPRKKRGLLMMSEKDNVTKRKKSDAKEVSAAPETRTFDTSDGNPHKELKSRRLDKSASRPPKKPAQEPPRQDPVEDRDDEDEAMVDIEDILSDREREKSPGFAVPRKKERRPSSPMAIEDDSEAETARSTAQARKRRQKKQSLAFEDEAPREPEPTAIRKTRSKEKRDDGNAPTDDLPPLRLEKFSRKSIRSREVHGFMFDDDFEPVMPGFGTSFSKTAAIATSATDAIASASASAKPPPLPAGLQPQDSDIPELDPAPVILSEAVADMPKEDGFSPEDTIEAPQPRPRSLGTSMRSKVAKAIERGTRQLPPHPTTPAQQTHDVDEGEMRRDGKDGGNEGVKETAMTKTTSAATTFPPAESISIPIAAAVPALPTTAPLVTSVPPAPARVTTPATTTTTKQPPPKLVNPATRGKKAARPSDAAGQMPVCPLPTDVTLPTTALRRIASVSSISNNNCISNIGNQRSRSLGNAMAKPNGNVQQVRETSTTTTTMPGFSKANGDPWSREASDLFEFKRPAGTSVSKA